MTDILYIFLCISVLPFHKENKILRSFIPYDISFDSMLCSIYLSIYLSLIMIKDISVSIDDNHVIKQVFRYLRSICHLYFEGKKEYMCSIIFIFFALYYIFLKFLTFYLLKSKSKMLNLTIRYLNSYLSRYNLSNEIHRGIRRRFLASKIYGIYCLF